MPWGRSDCSHRLGLYHPQPPKHKFCMRKTKATASFAIDFELASLEIILDQVNADLALPNTPSDLELWASFFGKCVNKENLKKDVLDSIAEREAEILAPKLEFHCRVSAKAPKQTAKTTEVPK
ncbi:hypothetical protein MTR_6g089960 [Medicago truncatula]|uniref:Uncharacterized protein n=1 Tax=Medicago truncatula TaxID=3880 RepID=G7KQH2_MEDTR|nr:hypothetical protein MTR_6g089960 [Medicago truncatula]